ncbi:MAG TPA: hypothetical protein VIK55_06910 [Paludibacter sp.]
MKGFISKALIISVIFLLSGCATYYRPINPPTLNYRVHDLQDGIDLSYKYDVLQERGNKKYAKNEDKNQVRIVALKLTNFTDSTINIGRDALFFSGKTEIYPLEPLIVKNMVKQSTPSYLLYLLFTVTTFSFTMNGSTTIYPIGYLLGPGLTIGNMATAASANRKLLNELNQYDLINRDVKKGETVYGIIGIRDNGFNPISLIITKK